MKTEQLQKLESLGILLSSYSKHAWVSEGNIRKAFEEEIKKIISEINELVNGTTS